MISVDIKDVKGLIIEQVVPLGDELLILCEDEKFLVFQTCADDIEQCNKLRDEMMALRYGLITKDQLSKHGQVALSQWVKDLKERRDSAKKDYDDINNQLDNLS